MPLFSPFVRGSGSRADICSCFAYETVFLELHANIVLLHIYIVNGKKEVNAKKLNEGKYSMRVNTCQYDMKLFQKKDFFQLPTNHNAQSRYLHIEEYPLHHKNSTLLFY